MSWNRKHRPYQISGLHLVRVREQLENLMQKGSISQALLFAGPKGTGKTSTSRILGAVLNDPDNEAAVDNLFFNQAKSKPRELKDLDKVSPLAEKILSGNSFVVQEMDAASNRGIDDVRALKERVMLPPQEGKMTVYILDEAHMLTTEAFNALLKLLEEPPAHAVFILATTELHKIPATILSRCQVIHFQQASDAEIVSALEEVLKKEKIKFEDEALQLIASKADGSFRDAIKLLELAAQNGTVTVEEVNKFARSLLTDDVLAVLDAVIRKEPAEVSAIFNSFREQAVDSKYLHKRVAEVLHEHLLISYGIIEGKAFAAEPVIRFLLTEVYQVDLGLPTPIPHLPLELKFLDIIGRAKKNNGNNQKKTSAPTSKKKAKNDSKIKVLAELITPPLSKKQDTVREAMPKSDRKETASKTGNGELLCRQWELFIDKVNEKNTTFAALLRSAKPLSGSSGEVEVSVYYKFHQEQLAHGKFLQMARGPIEEICGGYVDFTVTLTEPPLTADLSEPGDNNQEIPELAQVATEALM